jgi:hypothetical protein
MAIGGRTGTITMMGIVIVVLTDTPIGIVILPGHRHSRRPDMRLRP